MDVDCWILIVVTEKARVRKNNNFVRGCSVWGRSRLQGLLRVELYHTTTGEGPSPPRKTQQQ